MTGCIECGAPTPNRTCTACRLVERAADAAADQDAGVYDCPTCDGLSSSESVPCYKCRSEGKEIATDGGESDGEIDPSLLTDGGLNAESLSESDIESLELAADRVPEICEKLAVSEKVTDRACELARRADLEHVKVNRSPAAVAAGAVYLAACLKNEKRTQRRVGAVANVSEVTIRDTYHEIAEAEGYEIEPVRGRAPSTDGWRSKFESALARIRPTLGGDNDV